MFSVLVNKSNSVSTMSAIQETTETQSLSAGSIETITVTITEPIQAVPPSALSTSPKTRSPRHQDYHCHDDNTSHRPTTRHHHYSHQGRHYNGHNHPRRLVHLHSDDSCSSTDTDSSETSENDDNEFGNTPETIKSSLTKQKKQNGNPFTDALFRAARQWTGIGTQDKRDKLQFASPQMPEKRSALATKTVPARQGTTNAENFSRDRTSVPNEGEPFMFEVEKWCGSPWFVVAYIPAHKRELQDDAQATMTFTLPSTTNRNTKQRSVTRSNLSAIFHHKSNSAQHYKHRLGVHSTRIVKGKLHQISGECIVDMSYHRQMLMDPLLPVRITFPPIESWMFSHAIHVQGDIQIQYIHEGLYIQDLYRWAIVTDKSKRRCWLLSRQQLLSEYDLALARSIMLSLNISAQHMVLHDLRESNVNDSY